MWGNDSVYCNELRTWWYIILKHMHTWWELVWF